jgi:predicted DCC family thiol-disulfide oxidoreductase YuxK
MDAKGCVRGAATATDAAGRTPAVAAGGAWVPAARHRSAAGHGMTAPLADPAGFGAGRIDFLTVLYDAGSPLGRTARKWFSGRVQAVPLEFVRAGSAQARQRFPSLNHAATLRELTVISDTGLIWTGDSAWLTCLWALADHRRMAERLGSPRPLPAGRRFIGATADVRRSIRSGDYGGGCDDRRRPA